MISVVAGAPPGSGWSWPSLGVAVLVVAIAALARRSARTGGRRRPWGGPLAAVVPVWSPRVRRLAVRVRGPVRIADPVHLLRFRTAIERGASPLQAFESVAVGRGRWPVEAHRLVRRVGAGVSLQSALDGWAREDPDPAVRLLADALAISSTTGGSHLRAVDAVIDAVREHAALQREVRALASQARASALVLVVMPVLFALAVAAADPRVRMFFVGSALGPVCLLVGFLLDLAGAGLMARMIRGVS